MNKKKWKKIPKSVLSIVLCIAMLLTNVAIDGPLWVHGAEDAPENLLTNGTFLDGADEDTTADGWTYSYVDDNTMSPSEAGGGITIKATGNNAERLTLHQTYKPGSPLAQGTYTLSGMVNVSECVGTNNEVKINHLLNGASLNKVMAESYSGLTDGWVSFSEEIEITADNIESIKVEIEIPRNSNLTISLKNLSLKTSDGNELLKNGNFLNDQGNDDLADSWSYYYNDNTAKATTSISENGITMQADNSTAKRNAVYQIVTLNKGTYTFSGNIKVENYTKGYVNAYCIVGDEGRTKLKAYNTAGEHTPSKTFTITEDNTDVKVEFEVQIGAIMSATATNYSIKDSEGNEYITNGVFADGDDDSVPDGWTEYHLAPIPTEFIGMEIAATGAATERLTLYQENISLTEDNYTFSYDIHIKELNKGNVKVVCTLENDTKFVDKTYNVATKEPVHFTSEEFKVTSKIKKIEVIVSTGADLTVEVNNFSLKNSSGKECLTNGHFVDTDGDAKADDWKYYYNACKQATSTLIADGGIQVIGKSAQSLTLSQQVALEAGTYKFTGNMNVTAYTSGKANAYYKLGENVSTVGEYNTNSNNAFEQEIVVTEPTTLEFGFNVEKNAVLTLVANNFALVKVVEEEPEESTGNLITDWKFESVADRTFSAWSINPTEHASHFTSNGNGTLQVKYDGSESVGKGTFSITHEITDLTAGEYILSGNVNVSEISTGSFQIKYIINGEEQEAAYYAASTTRDFPKTISIPVGTTSMSIKILTYEGAAGRKLDATVSNLSLVKKIVPVTGVTIDNAPTTMVVDSEVTLEAIVEPETATDKTVTWGSSDPTVATVGTDGKVTALKAGTTTITVTSNADNNIKATCEITVTDKPVAATGVTIDQTSETLFIGEKVTLTATVTPDNATDKTVTWASLNPEVATVDSATGEVTAVAVGTATITATINGHTANCVITVKKLFDGGLITNGGFADDIKKITTGHNPGKDGKAVAWQYWYNGTYVLPTINLIDNGLEIIATGKDGNNNTQRVTIQQTVSNLTVGYSYTFTGAYKLSDVNGTFKIDINGVEVPTSKTDDWQTFSTEVTATNTTMQIRIVVDPGTVVTASVKEFNLTLVDPLLVKEITITDAPTTMVVDTTATLGVTIKPDTAAENTVAWESSDDAIATVDSTGKVTAKGTGTVTITATANGKSTTCQIEVLAKAIDAEKVEVNPSIDTLYVDEKLTLEAIITPDNTTDKKVTWSSNDESVAIVDSETGEVTAVAVGEATITATTVNGLTSTCTITVKELFDSGLLINGGFEDDIQSITVGDYAGKDGKAEAWQYWTDKVLPSTTLFENGLIIDAKSKTNNQTERVTIQQTITGLTAGHSYILTGAYNVSSTTTGSFSIDIKDAVNNTTLATIASHTSKTDGEQKFSQEVVATSEKMQIRIVVSSGAELTASVKEFKLVEVDPLLVKDITIKNPPATVVIGSETTLEAVITPTTAQANKITWESSNTNVATVDENGKLTAKATGTVTITATANSKSTTCEITIIEKEIPVESVTLDKTAVTLYAGGATTLTATVVPSNATYQTVTWTSSDADVAYVDEEGNVTAEKSGTATITARVNDEIAATCEITVKERDADVVKDKTNYIYNPTFTGLYYGWASIKPEYMSVNNGVLTITGNNLVQVNLNQTIERDGDDYSAGTIKPGKYVFAANVEVLKTDATKDITGALELRYAYKGVDANGATKFSGAKVISKYQKETTDKLEGYSIEIPETFEVDGVTYTVTAVKFEINVTNSTSNMTAKVSNLRWEKDTRRPLVPVAGGMLGNVNYETYTPNKPETITGWVPWSDSKTAGTYTTNVTDAALSVNVTGDEFTLYQNVTPTVFGKYYVLTGKMKTEGFTKVDGDTTSGGSVQLYVRLLDANNKEIAGGSKATAYISGTTDWKDYIVVVPVPETINGTAVKTIKVEHKVNYGTGTASFKDLKLVATDIAYDATNMIQNPAYICEVETMIQNWGYSPAGFAGNNADVDVTDGVVTLTGNGNTDAPQQMYQEFTGVDTNAIYRLTGYIKATDLTANALIRIRLTDTEKGAIDVCKNLVTITGTTEWVPIDVTFEVPETFYKSSLDAQPTAVGGFKLEKVLPSGQNGGSVSFKELRLEKDGTLNNTKYPIVGDGNNSVFVNGGFERYYEGLPRWWNVWESTGGLKVYADTEVKHTGNYSIHITNVTEGAESRGSVHQTIETRFNQIPNNLQQQSMKFNMWIKTKGWEGTGFSIRLQYKSESGLPVELTSKFIDIAKDQDWTEYDFILDLPKVNLKLIKVEFLYDECVGDIWIDDLSVDTYIKGTGIQVTEDAIILEKDDTKQLDVKVLSSVKDTFATIQDVTYRSTDENVVKVDKTGKITAVGNGYARIVITQEDGCKKSIAVLVTDNTFTFNESMTAIATEMNVKKLVELPAGYKYKALGFPQYGSVVVDKTTLMYYPDKNFAGSDKVTLLVTNAEGAQTLVTLDITVGAISSTPVFDNFLINTNKDEQCTGGMVATDIETVAADLTYKVTKAPAHGTLTIVGDNYTFVPEKGYSGYDTAEVTVTDKDKDAKSATATVTIYVAPSIADIRDSIKVNKVNKTHSYILADDAKFATLAKQIADDTEMKTVGDWYYNDVFASTTVLLGTDPIPNECPDGVRLNTNGSNNAMKLAFVYRIMMEMAETDADKAEAKKYLDRAWVEIENLCNPAVFEDWHPSHLLDVAMTATGVATAYDWLYDDLTAEQREYVELALYKNALLEGEFQFEDNHMFVTNGFNWNYVCNGGFATAAFALLTSENEEYANKAAEILQRVYKSIQYGLPQYAPEGDSIEGVSYWSYGTRFVVSFLATVSSSIGKENNIFLDTPGMKETALYPIHMTGKAGTFNYSDNDTSDSVGYYNLWLAEAYNEPFYAWYHQYYMSDPNHKASIFDLLYYNEKYYNSDKTLELDNFYTAQAVTTMRTDYTDSTTAFLGFKGGITGAPHGDLDIGTFVYDMYGTRWVVDTGKENYNMLGYWELNSGGVRWSYYRKDASGHNTILINPTNKGENQTIGTYTGKIEQSLNNPGGGYTILDMTDAYQKQAAELYRGVAFFNRRQVLVRDEFVLKEAGELYWQLHTRAKVEISEDGKTAILTQDGKQIKIKIVGEENDYTFDTMAAVYYGDPESNAATGNSPSGATGALVKEEYDRTDLVKLYIKASDVQTGSISVLITPMDDTEPEVKALDDWSEYDFSELHVHEFMGVVTEPDCVNPGRNAIECSCGLVKSEEIIPALGHDHKYEETKATCTTDGYKEYKCSRCDDTYVDDKVAALGHDYVTETVKATCTTDGYDEHVCSRCEDTYKDNEVKAAGHKYEVTEVKATCTEDGKYTEKCACGDVKEDKVIKKLGHDYVTETVKATCTTDGYDEHVCSRCEDTYKDNEVKAAGHKYEVTEVKATCTEDGKYTEKCACGDVKEDKVLDKLGHDYKETVIEPTYEADGYTLHECTRCDVSYKDRPTDKLVKDPEDKPDNKPDKKPVDKVEHAPAQKDKEKLEKVTEAIIEKILENADIEKVMSKETVEKVKEAIAKDKVVATVVVLEPVEEDKVSAESKEVIEEAIDKFADDKNAKVEVAQYIDIQLVLRANGSEDLGTLSELDEPIIITIEVPEDMKKFGRKYYVARNHNGKVDMLETTENEDGTISFETDRFSDYVLLFEDTVTEDIKPDDSKPDDSKPDDNKPNGSESDDKKPDDSKPDDSKPDDNKPNGSESDDKKPDDSKPNDSESDDKKPDDSKPDDDKSDDDNAPVNENSPFGIILLLIAIVALVILFKKKFTK